MVIQWVFSAYLVIIWLFDGYLAVIWWFMHNSAGSCAECYWNLQNEISVRVCDHRDSLCLSRQHSLLAGQNCIFSQCSSLNLQTYFAMNIFFFNTVTYNQRLSKYVRRRRRRRYRKVCPRETQEKSKLALVIFGSMCVF